MNLSDIVTIQDFLNIDPEVVSSMDDNERVVFQAIMTELSSTGDSETLRQLWMEDYDQIPVDIDTFLDDPYYLGSSVGDALYPYWRTVFRKIFAPGANVDECVLSGGIGLGKTYFATIGMAYVLHRLLCLRDPQKYYGLNSTSTIVIAMFSVTLQQVYGTAWNRFHKMLCTSPWFQENGVVLGDEGKETYLPNKGIQIKAG